MNRAQTVGIKTIYSFWHDTKYIVSVLLPEILQREKMPDKIVKTKSTYN